MVDEDLEHKIIIGGEYYGERRNTGSKYKHDLYKSGFSIGGIV